MPSGTVCLITAVLFPVHPGREGSCSQTQSSSTAPGIKVLKADSVGPSASPALQACLTSWSQESPRSIQAASPPSFSSPVVIVCMSLPLSPALSPFSPVSGIPDSAAGLATQLTGPVQDENAPVQKSRRISARGSRRETKHSAPAGAAAQRAGCSGGCPDTGLAWRCCSAATSGDSAQGMARTAVGGPPCVGERRRHRARASWS